MDCLNPTFQKRAFVVRPPSPPGVFPFPAPPIEGAGRSGKMRSRFGIKREGPGKTEPFFSGTKRGRA